MKCNFSITGYCVYGFSHSKPQYQIKMDKTADELSEIAKQLAESSFEYLLSQQNVEIIPLSSISCDGEGGKDGCPVRKW